ncbi:terminase large subunit [Flavobacterium phage 11b]|uniref:terminase large subunit n=1 Tax=Flavobacterium phage 11b TaxID=294631 RepID=UPI000044412D|nr:terminase large subunit [Flavobacterium phage 11b]CAH56642.1 terminase large subunit [Flavobacterium phage 11b]
MNLILKQEHAAYYLKDKETKELIYGGAAGGGKSALGILWLIEQCQAYPGTRWLMGRSKLKALKETTLNTFFEQASILKITEQYNYNAQSGVIYWNNGSEILLKDLYAYPSDQNFDSLGSLEISGAFIDECNQITYKAWQIVKSRIRYKLNQYGIEPKMLGTCNPAKNWVYAQFYLKDKNGTLDNDKKFIQALPTDNPHLPASYLTSLLSLDENSKQRLYYGNWEYDNDPAKLIDYEKIQNCFTNTFIPFGEMYISADIARFGSDKMVICVWSGFRVVEIFSMAKSSITEIAEAVRGLSIKHKVPLSNVICDEDGVGGGVVDVLGCTGFINNSRAMEVDNQVVQYQNLKTQCYYKLAEVIQSNNLYIHSEDATVNDEITKELEQVKRDKIDSDGKLQLISKDKVKQAIGRSPDYSDALMMRMYFEFKPKFFTF